MAFVIPVKLRKAGSPVGFQEFQPGDRMAGNLIEGWRGRNQVMNGMFQVWQRNNIFPAASQVLYTVDRWKLVALNSTGAITRDDYQLSDLTAPGRYICRVTSVAAGSAGSAVNIQQPIEDVRTLSGKQCVLSFWAKANVDGFVSAELTQNFGTGGSSTVEGIGATKVPVTTGWERYSIPVTIPSVAGKIQGPNDALNIVLWIDAGANYAARTAGLGTQTIGVSFSGIRLEEGTVASEDETPHISDELIRCQRYYEKSYSQGVYPGAADRSGSYRCSVVNGFFFAAGSVPFAVVKRIPPAMTMYAARDGSVGNGSEVNSSGVFVANRNVTPSNIGTAQFQTGSNNGGVAAGNTIEFHWTSDAEF